MNKAFKVLWNQVRNTYVVASEAQATHGKPGKATKTIVAAAVAGLMAVGTASAATITNETLQDGQQAFIQGNGEKLEIQTSGSLGGILSQLQQNHSGLSDILNGLIQNDGTYKSIVGVTGGKIYASECTLILAGAFPDAYMQGILGFDLVSEKLVTSNPTGSDIKIGGDGSNPVVMGLSSGDIVLNVNLGDGVQDMDVTRENPSNVTISSGNVLGGVAGGTAININLFLAEGMSSKTTFTQNGGSNLTINGTATALGIFGGGMSVGVGERGTATSIVNGTSKVTIDTTVNSSQLEGLVIGAAGAGLSVATGGSTAITQTNATQIDIEQGMVLGTIGGGMALTSDPSIIGKVSSSAGELAGLLGNGGGNTQSMVLGDTEINATAGSTTALLMGGGIAVANSENGASTATATTNGNITINLDGGDNVFNDKPDDETNKLAFHGAAEAFIDFGKNVFKQLTDSKVPFDTQAFIKDLQENVKNLNYQGVHVGNLGAGIAVAKGVDGENEAIATADVQGTVNFNLNGGYNVANMAGGIAVAWGDSETAQGQVLASSTTTGTKVTISGGENILVAAGGAAFATAGHGENSKVQAVSTVGTAGVEVTGGITDGIYGGGVAVDDTNQTEPNAIANANNVDIKIKNGVVNEANTSMIDRILGEHYLTPTNAPSKRAYIYDTVKLLDQANVAVLGAGMASGGGAQANTVLSNIELTGGTINGSVFGGGAATFDGSVNVEESRITVDGADATVNGSIYGGGLVGGPRNDISTYDSPKSHVGTSTIALYNGTVTGNIYAGGYVYKDESGVAQVIEDGGATVETSHIILGSNDILTKEDAIIDGQGAKTSTLTFVNDEFDMTGKNVTGFDEIQGNAQSVQHLNYTFGEKGQTTVTGDVAFGTLGNAEDAGKTLLIGGEDAAGAVSVKASGSALNLTVSNGLLALNVDSTDDAIAAYAGAGAKNAVYVTGTVDDTYLHNGSKVTVGDVADAQNPGIYVGADGALIADADGDTTVSANLEMRNGSKVHFADVAQAAAGDKKVIADIDATIATSVDNVLYTATRNENGEGGVYFTFGQRSASELEEVGLGDVDDIAALNDIATQSDDASDYINMFMDQSTGSIDSSNRSQQINAAMNLAAAAGVQTVAIDSATMGIDAAAKRASVINDFAEGGVLFAEATGKRFEMGGTPDFGAIKTELGGIVVGGEYTTGDWTFGALANLGTGTVRGQDANSGVKNDVDYYGVQAYAAKRLGAFNVVGQVGYVQTSNDVTHTTVGMEKADIDANVMSVGVRGEMRFDISENARLVPYVGVNYLRVSTDGFDTDQGLEVKDQDQDLVTIPVGVKFAGDMQSASGWTWTPSVDVGYVAALGDRDSDARTKVGATTVHTSMDVWSESVVRTSVGLKAQKDNWGFGVQAGSAMGSDDTKELFGQVRVDYRF